MSITYQCFKETHTDCNGGYCKYEELGNCDHDADCWVSCDCEHHGLDKEIIACAVCKAKFNVLKADWCKHNPRHTKLCPNGHCICDRLDSGIWKEANEKEKIYGIERVYIGKE
jgi:hypothetical protein